MNRFISTFLIVIAFMVILVFGTIGYIAVRWVNWKISYEDKVYQVANEVVLDHVKKYHPGVIK